MVMDGTRCLLNVGTPAAVVASADTNTMEDLLPPLPGPFDSGDGSAALCAYTTLSQDGAGPLCAFSLLEDVTSDNDSDDSDDTMSRDLSKALGMSTLSCTSQKSTRKQLYRERSHHGENTTGNFCVHVGQETPNFFAKVLSIFSRRNSTGTDTGKGQHSQELVATQCPAPPSWAVKSTATQSLCRQQELEDAQYARVVTNFRTIGWCSPSEIESVEYKRSLINALWDEKISLLSDAQCYK